MKTVSRDHPWQFFARPMSLLVIVAACSAAVATEFVPPPSPEYPVGKDSSVRLSGQCLGAEGTRGGGLVIDCGRGSDVVYFRRWLALFPPVATDRTVQEESRVRHAQVERELGLGKPIRDFPQTEVAGTAGPSATIMHTAFYKPDGFFSVNLVTFTRVSPAGKVFFGVYASADSNNLAAGLDVVMKQFGAWRPASSDALPHPATMQNVESAWGSGFLGLAHGHATAGAAMSAEAVAKATKAALPRLVGTWSGRSTATIRAYSGFGTTGRSVQNLPETVTDMTVDEGPATLRIRPDGSYLMHSDWTFSGCRVVRDHDGAIGLIGSPEPRAMRLQAAHFVERVEKTKSWVTCKVGTTTQAPAMQFDLVWSSAGPMNSLNLTRHEDGDSPNTSHHMSLLRQAGK